MKGITQSSSDKYSQVEGIYKLLQFDNEAVLEIAHDIIDECFKQAKYDINISRTGEGEILIYTQMEGQYRNIIIDRDADIEYLYVPADRKKTANEYYSFVMGFDYNFIKNLVAKL